MKLPSRLSTIGLSAGIVVGLALALVTVSQVSAQDAPLSSDQLQRIQANCQSVKSTLGQLHASDGLLRVNRGQFYESLADDLMDPFSTRLSSNGIDATAFNAITNSYRATLTTFSNDYRLYEQQLSNTIAIDCTKQPATFNDALKASQSRRTKVHDDVVQLNQDISNYKSAVATLATNYSQVSTGVSQ